MQSHTTLAPLSRHATKTRSARLPPVSPQELQEYLAALRAHPEAPTLRAFADFVRPPDQPSAFPVDSNPLVRELSAAARSSSPGAIVRSRSGTHLDRTEAAPPAPTCTRVKLSWVDEDGDHEVELPVLTPAHALGNKVLECLLDWLIG